MRATNAKVASRRAAANVYRGTGHTAYAQQVTKAFRFTFALPFSYSFTFFIYVYVLVFARCTFYIFAKCKF